jgi:hypothetical protein
MSSFDEGSETDAEETVRKMIAMFEEMVEIIKETNVEDDWKKRLKDACSKK